MNERIKELAVQASHQSPDGYPVTIPYSKDFVKKFAELIVRECAKNFAEEPDKPFYGRHVAHQIKQQFGVE
jgi:hypothetical protein